MNNKTQATFFSMKNVQELNEIENSCPTMKA